MNEEEMQTPQEPIEYTAQNLENSEEVENSNQEEQESQELSSNGELTTPSQNPTPTTSTMQVQTQATLPQAPTQINSPTLNKIILNHNQDDLQKIDPQLKLHQIACITCPNSMWQQTPKKIQCYCRLTNDLSWESTTREKYFKECDGRFIEQDQDKEEQE